MKNILILILVLLAISCQNSTNFYVIKGSISGIDKGKVYLQKVDGGKALTIDSLELSDQKFVFKGIADESEIYYLRLNEKDYFAQFFVDPTTIKIQAYKDSLRSTVITGSPTTDIYSIYVDELERLSNEISRLKLQYRKAMMKGDVDQIDKIKIDVEAMSDNMKVFTKNFVRDHSGSVVAAFVFLWQLSDGLPVDEMKELVALFPEEISGTRYVKEARKLVEQLEITSIGAEAPDFTMNDPEGNPITLSSLRGKVVMIDFWASWCTPCRQENPNVVKLYRKYNHKGFEILGVSLDRNRQDWLNAIEKDNLTWKHVSDLKYWQNEVARQYLVHSIPQTFLLDKNGIIIGKDLRGEQLESKLQEILNEI